MAGAGMIKAGIFVWGLAFFLAACSEQAQDTSGAVEDETLGGARGAAPRTAGNGAAMSAVAPAASRPMREDVIYFVMPDRFFNGDRTNDQGNLSGDRLVHGFDPADKAFYHGGDLPGLLKKLDYLEGLGVTAIWMTPIFKNKPVQGDVNGVSAGYHGYWITDFTRIDPHFGTNDDLKRLVSAAHDRGIKVIFDIITNHTADVIKYRECAPGTDAEGRPAKADLCTYRPKANYPYTRRAADGAPINDGFLGDQPPHQTDENFARLTDPGFAYTPFLPEGEEAIKVPAWLNDPIYYHNRGDSHWEGESSLYGDFASLDDLMTEHPRVVRGMIDIYKHWISEFRIDGFRVDTVRHVGMEFWSEMAPALMAHARSEGLEHFFIFGEVFHPDPAYLSRFTRRGRLPSVLDFGFQSAVTRYLLDGGTGDELAAFFKADDYYIRAGVSARDLPTFLGNHDMGRFGHFIVRSGRADNDGEALALDRLGHTLMYTARGIPVVYYGDEQGFTGDGKDQDARENMQPSRVASYNDNDLIGSGLTPAADNFDETHPLYTHLAELAALRLSESALVSGAQITRLADGQVFAFSRFDMATGQEILVALNAGDEARDLVTAVATPGARWSGLLSGDTATSDDSGRIALSLPRRDIRVFKADRTAPRSHITGRPVPGLGPVDGDGGRFMEVDLSATGPVSVSFFQETETDRTPLGTDLSPPYRLYVDPAVLSRQTLRLSATITPFGGASETVALYFPIQETGDSTRPGTDDRLETNE